MRLCANHRRIYHVKFTGKRFGAASHHLVILSERLTYYYHYIIAYTRTRSHVKPDTALLREAPCPRDNILLMNYKRLKNFSI